MNWTQEQIDARNREVFGKGGDATEHPPTERAEGSDTPEALIEIKCTELLEADGWRALRTDPVSDRSRGKGFGEIGMADHLYIRYDGMDNVLDISDPRPECTEICVAALCQVLWVEFKSAKGKPKKHQIDWHGIERGRGALTLIAGLDFPPSIEGFRQWYDASGLRRRS